MIVLLPLRGWMGEVMATEVAAMNIIAVKATDTSANIDLPTGKGLSDCDMHKAKTAEPSTAKPACNYCQACHATGMATAVEIHSFDKVFYTQPLMQLHPYTSASLAPGQKPPIL